ncbi:TIGR02679 family protein [Oceanobacillus halophilus]|uniref:TIGR02679 family protein n=1 Tax=Oceanobacillus halophilus TaxID=930130 RepID=A0A495A9B4_9BACI|nr:TIGR02679 family protein [Oceanobacillus halophilus]RKQ35845.1 TIGR02679 family protein [Oceanobacillus halophilus]
MEEVIKEAVDFFKGEQAFQKLFKQFRKKYESLGRIGGTISAKLFSMEELEIIGGFYGANAEQLKEKGSISLMAFEKQLSKTRFSGLELKGLLDAYFGETLLSKQEKKSNQEKKRQEIFYEFSKKYPCLSFWFHYVSSSPKDGRWIIRLAEEHDSEIRHLVATLARAYSHIPDEPVRLPVFSQQIAGDPHALDVTTDLGKLFLHVLTVDLERKKSQQLDLEYDRKETGLPASTESINELLQHFHLFRDDLLNFVTCSGLLAETKEGVEHPVWRTASEWNTVFNMPLRELISLHRVFPLTGTDVWVVENSGVCSTLLDLHLKLPIVSTNGQFKLAALTLLDFLAIEGCTIHYAGDFDPEGLRMAQRLLNRYPEQVELWHMNLEDYRKTIPVKVLEKERLAKLNGIKHKDLKDVAEEMRRIGKAGYQEALLNDMKQDLIDYTKSF